MSTIRCDIGGSKHHHEVEVKPGSRKRPVGSARRAVLAMHASRDRKVEKTTGMKFLGEGVAKTCYTDERHVYKVPLEYDGCSCDDCGGTGADEYQHWNEFAIANGGGLVYDFEQKTWVEKDPDRRPSWASPTSAYIVDGTCVLAQPKVIPADNIRWDDPRYQSMRQQLDEVGRSRRSILGDMHPGNYGVTKNGRLRIFDLGA